MSESTLDELDDDELALLGAPWAKEGMLWRKSTVEAGGKKTGGKGGWKQYFVVIQKSDLHLFTFGEGGGTSFGGGTVGGGNWLVSRIPPALLMSEQRECRWELEPHTCCCRSPAKIWAGFRSTSFI